MLSVEVYDLTVCGYINWLTTKLDNQLHSNMIRPELIQFVFFNVVAVRNFISFIAAFKEKFLELLLRDKENKSSVVRVCDHDSDRIDRF